VYLVGVIKYAFDQESYSLCTI